MSGPTFRHESYKEYKANRQETPEDVKAGIPIVKDIVKAFNIPVLEMEGYEADDIIGTIAKKAAPKGYTVFMMTPDKDFGSWADTFMVLTPSTRAVIRESRGTDRLMRSSWRK